MSRIATASGRVGLIDGDLAGLDPDASCAMLRLHEREVRPYRAVVHREAA